MHVYTDDSAKKVVRDGGSGVLVRFSDKEIKSMSAPGGKLSTNYWAEILDISTVPELLTDLWKNVENSIFSDSRKPPVFVLSCMRV